MFKRTKKEIINSILKIKNLSDEDCKDLDIFENRFKSIIDDIDNSYREFCNTHSKLCNTIKKLAKEISYVKNDMSNEEIKRLYIYFGNDLADRWLSCTYLQSESYYKSIILVSDILSELLPSTLKEDK